jgi:hypothetical protein
MRTIYIFSFVVLLCFWGNNVLAQEQIGGPYTVDDNTVLLMHFDGNLTNESTMSDDGVGHGNYSFFPRADFSQCLRFDNDALSDSSYVTVPDNDNLDMTGSWTIEGWINVFTFGQSSSDHRWVPRLVIKPGDVVFYQPNYWVELWGDNRWFQTGFHTADEANWPAVTSAPNVMVPGQWVHLTFIRDDVRKIIVQMVHNEQRELIWFGSASYADLPEMTPITTSQDVHIGWAGAIGIETSSTDSWLDGFVDEIRISNIVRDFPVPPVITGLTQVQNQEASVTSYEVKVNAFAFAQTGSIQSAVLSYTIDDGATWSTVNMTATTGDTLAGTIPQQPVGSVIRYFVTITDDRGQEATYPSTGNDPLSFGIYQPNSQVLDLAFEEGSGDIIDHSIYQQGVSNYRGPFYSNDAVEGSWSYEFPADEDSSFLAVDSPFLTATEFALDYWFKAEGDTVLPFIRMIIRSASGNHVDQNYYVRTEEANGISARYQVDPTLETRTKNDVNLIMPNGTIAPNTWYHVQFERSDSLAVFKIFNEDGVLLGKAYDAEDIALNPPRPGVTPLKIGGASNTWDGTLRNLKGKMDAIRIYNYAALGMDTLGTVGTVSVGDDVAAPASFVLHQNYPNPFNPETAIKFEVPVSGNVELIVYDVLGREVSKLVNEFKSPGTYNVKWNGTNEFGRQVSSGVYFYKLVSSNNVITRKMVMLR